MAKKRRRSDSFQADDDDARKRLAAFHARMFEMPQEDAPAATPETPRVAFKAKSKKHKKKSSEADDGEPVPVVKFHKVQKKKEKKKKQVATVADKILVNGPSVVKAPGVSNHVKNKPQGNNTEKKNKVIKTNVRNPQRNRMKKNEVTREEYDGVDPLEQALGSVQATVTVRKVKKVKKKTVQSPPIHSVNVEKEEEDDEMDPLEQALGSISAMVTTQEANSPPKKKRKHVLLAAPSEEKQADIVDITREKEAPAAVAVKNDAAGGANVANLKSKKKRDKKKRKEAAKLGLMNSISPKTQTSAQPRQGTLLLVSDEVEDQVVSSTTASKKPNSIPSKTAKTAPTKEDSTIVKTVAAKKKAVPYREKKAEATTKPLTPIAASLAKDATKKNDMFVSAQETQCQRSPSPKRSGKTIPSQVVQLADASASSESEDDFDRRDNSDSSFFSRLIDSAARERWELVEVGRLVRLFAAQWDFKASKTARFLLDTCPELVSVDFLEGLGVNLSAKQLVQVFEAGSGNPGVMMNKMASAVENGHLSVRDPSFVSALERRVALMESNAEVMELLHPLLESLSTVRDVGCLLKQLCEHWQLERKISLVQQVLLSNVFDDLDGNQDEILLDLPDLTGRLDFPSRLDQEDVDENGNLKGFLANEDSEFSGEEGSEEEEHENDSEDDEFPCEGETDSDEEMEISGCSRSRNQFIEDEADVGEDEDEEDTENENEHLHDDGSSSDSD
ncbi:hypothetical protein GN244_ATG03863 [Phytophthora infestans]|uniref:Uncharacterized protein n=1 Tax=Phytophthora infestans TaxID=4787 RepID=A0A833WZZ0_PHYIN|nr:hypothetical protein GN244_ATG03863 [Phytophthora infestans]KAF4134022.1 hypothetical protein GN958_ATG16704 [Phytophthora infestans]